MKSVKELKEIYVMDRKLRRENCQKTQRTLVKTLYEKIYAIFHYSTIKTDRNLRQKHQIALILQLISNTPMRENGSTWLLQQQPCCRPV